MASAGEAATAPRAMTAARLATIERHPWIFERMDVPPDV